MTDTVAGRESAIAQLKTLITGVTDVTIPHCYRHEPRAVYADRYAAIVYRGITQREMTMGNVMRAFRFEIQVYWQMQVDPGTLDAIEKEILDTDAAIETALFSDLQLGGNVTRMIIEEPSDVDYIMANEAPVARRLTIPVLLEELEAESISL